MLFIMCFFRFEGKYRKKILIFTTNFRLSDYGQTKYAENDGCSLGGHVFIGYAGIESGTEQPTGTD
jgi:hypothetical protein